MQAPTPFSSAFAAPVSPEHVNLGPIIKALKEKSGGNTVKGVWRIDARNFIGSCSHIDTKRKYTPLGLFTVTLGGSHGF